MSNFNYCDFKSDLSTEVTDDVKSDVPTEVTVEATRLDTPTIEYTVASDVGKSL